MRAVDIIIKKRDGGTLTAQEIDFFVRGFTNGEIPDYQASAFAMAVLLNGMTNFETTDLTLSMARSGSTLDLSKVVDLAVDKHSSGGVGDKTSIAVMPMVAACGLAVGKMSGRGLGFSGGTLDKLESIPGYRVDLTTDEFLEQLKEKGIVLTGQSLDLAPADGKLYALRDVTGTVPSMPLIASSIMCKKIAAGAQAIVLDVKVGRGAFMQTLEEGRELAELMVDIGRLAGRKTVALLSDMNQPLGSAVGNALEVIESIETLRGRGPADFVEHCLHVAAHVLVLGRRASDLDEGRSLARKSIADGSALEKLRILVAAQGGDASYVDDVSRFTRAKFREEIKTPRSGFVSQVNARTVGEASVELGAGRAKKGDPINHAVGFLIYKKVGDEVRGGEALCEVHADDAEKLQKAREAVLSAYQIGDEPIPPLPLFYE
ncbi:MAG: Pyrimidine-nucleoside phosphorylase [Anaerolineales bacterium]|nr:Pyrimidine-nucleoside phosphorylase [Anaerolineales bacterium]